MLEIKKSTGPLSSVISEINTEFTNKITEIQKNNSHDEYEISSSRAEWKDILSVYAVLVSNGEEQTDLITLDDTGPFPYLEKPTIFNIILNSFLIGDEE